MEKIPIKQEVMLSRRREIEKKIEKITVFKGSNLENFKKGENYAIAEHYLRRALEAIFDIGTHIGSRFPGVRISTYKDVALFLGKEGIVPQHFAKEKLLKMAGYRNRLVHFYAEVTIDELYEIIQNRLEDFNEFLQYLKLFLTVKEVRY